MDTKTMLERARRGAERLARIADTKVGDLRAQYKEEAIAVAWLLRTHPLSQPLPKFDERAADAQIAVEVASKARRVLEAMGQPQQHVKGWATRTHGKSGVAELPAVKDKQ